jgi:glutathione S-transferase
MKPQAYATSSAAPGSLRAHSTIITGPSKSHGDLKHIYGEAPVALDSAAAYFATQLRHAEQALQDGRPFLVGGRLTTADMLLTTCLAWAVSYGVPVTPACHAYTERITARPTYRAAVAANTPRSTA